MKRHQAALIQRLKSVEPVLEHLREQNVLCKCLFCVAKDSNQLNFPLCNCFNPLTCSSRGVQRPEGSDISPAANGPAHRARPHQGQRCSRGLPQLDPEKRRALAQRPHGYFADTHSILTELQFEERSNPEFKCATLAQSSEASSPSQDLSGIDTPASASRALLLLSSFPHRKCNYVRVIPDRSVFRPPHGGAAAAPPGGAYL